FLPPWPFEALACGSGGAFGVGAAGVGFAGRDDLAVERDETPAPQAGLVAVGGHGAGVGAAEQAHAAFPFVAVVARRYARRAVSRETWNRSASAGHVHPSSRSSASSAVCWSVSMCVQPIERRSFCSSSRAWASAWTISRSASRASSGGLPLATPFSASSRRRIVCCI